jgi:hypothetical protein
MKRKNLFYLRIFALLFSIIALFIGHTSEIKAQSETFQQPSFISTISSFGDTFINNWYCPPWVPQPLPPFVWGPKIDLPPQMEPPCFEECFKINEFISQCCTFCLYPLEVECDDNPSPRPKPTELVNWLLAACRRAKKYFNSCDNLV